MDLKQKLEQQVKEQTKDHGKTVTISSDDVSSAMAESKDAALKNPEDKIKETDTIVVSDAVKNNSVLKAADVGDVQKEIGADIVESMEPLDKHMRIVVDDGEPEKITITPEIKQAFIDGIVTNKRFVLPFSLFGGKIEGEIQSRTQNESFAIFEQLNRELSEDLTSQLAYSIKLRNMLLTAQVMRLNGDHFVGLKDPLFTMVDGDKTTPPGWLSQIDYWANKDEGIVNVIYKELRKFEYMYLTMMENSNNQNFWKTGLSI